MDPSSDVGTESYELNTACLHLWNEDGLPATISRSQSPEPMTMLSHMAERICRYD